jgi:outer membrane protein assembly factor BamD (BamD/ComL family)
MLVRLATLALLGSALVGWRPMDDSSLRLAESVEQTIHPTRQQCDRDLAVGRWYFGKHDYVAAIGRLKVIVTKCPATADMPEVLANLTEAFLARGAAIQAQTAVAVLERKFPGDPSTVVARNALGSAGLHPAEDVNSWISLALQ